MLFTSYTYFVFLAIVVVLARLSRRVAREYVLLAASLIFYAAWDPRYLPVLLGLGFFTYFAGQAVARSKKKFTTLLASVAVVLLVLGIFKYTGMLVGIADLFLPDAYALGIPKIVLPLGISFFTFECVSYLLDVHQGQAQLRPLRRFLLFPAFFPHLVAGPILRIREFAPQVEKPRDATAAELLAGFDRILVGLVKKLVIANQLAPFVDGGFGAANATSATDSWILALAFGLQIYFDFSSYTDIAIGSARMLGFAFPENFNLPYHAKNPSEFWNRWHMTLSRWIRDYVFFPLNLRAGRRIWLRYVDLVFVMMIIGLWHGAGITFILWGAWHGVLMVAHRILQKPVGTLPPRAQRICTWLGWPVTFALIQAGWVLFRAQNLPEAGHMLDTMFLLRGLKPAFSVNDYLMVLFALGAYFVFEPFAKRLADRAPEQIDHSGFWFWCRAPVYAAAVQLIFMFDVSNVAFIYFQF